MFSRSIFLMAAIVGLSPAALAQTAPRGLKQTWGKPGVSFEQYRADAVTCGTIGYNRDISDSDAARAFVNGSRRLDSVYDNMSESGAIEAARIVEGVRPEKRMAEVKALLLSGVSECLSALGYRRFQLTGAQSRRLARLRKGSAERHVYLYRLASDPEVIAAQSI